MFIKIQERGSDVYINVDLIATLRPMVKGTTLITLLSGHNHEADNSCDDIIAMTGELVVTDRPEF